MESITQGVEDQEVTIECKADGKPSPEYEFYRLLVSVAIIITDDLRPIKETNLLRILNRQ